MTPITTALHTTSSLHLVTAVHSILALPAPSTPSKHLIAFHHIFDTSSPSKPDVRALHERYFFCQRFIHVSALSTTSMRSTHISIRSYLMECGHMPADISPLLWA
ncbi:uncharacterized protein F5147DRAFT_723726 [Suillus discolor]|uniref:Uncharacterized protein n=1 Tax=Suillus discolor TaxID=1912936 RepID=A0A9P7EU63_9AGAM|nr:uncharacterized protein F5147DRAFT_723726 [Suillus discolor]KAG2091319.1 hypothetical protein F5147DRAFT_723726 [Suillus discolor]